MRALIIIPFCFAVAACSDDSGDNKAVAQSAPATLPAGQWQATWEVTAMRATDHAPKTAIEAKVGDKEQGPICVDASAPDKPDPALFAGPGYDCQYKNSYIKDGMMTADIACHRAGVTGDINMGMRGTYDSKSFEGTVETTTYLPGPGDFVMNRKISGRLTGAACQPGAAGGAGNAAAADGNKAG